MRPGARVGERWEVTAPAPGEAQVGRWRGVDRATGEPVEILALHPAAAHPRAEHGAFLALHRAVQRAHDPALIAVHDVGWSGASAWVVRAPLEDRTLADVRARLDPGTVAAIGARLVPAILAVAEATGGALSARDIGIDAQGAPVLAPRGRPADRLTADDARCVAPETLRGAPPDAAAALYGLGVILYRLATGHQPGPAGGSPVRAGSWVPGLPSKLEEALARLLSARPNDRAAAFPLLQEVASTLPDLRTRFESATPAAATATVGQVKVTTTVDTRLSHARPDIARPRSAVVIPARTLAALDPATASAAAGATGLSAEAMSAMAREGRPLVLAAHAGRRTASARREEATRAGALPGEVVARPSLAWPASALLGGGLLLALVPLALITGWSALGALSGLLALIVVALVLQWRHLAGRWRQVEAAWRDQRRVGDTAPPIRARRGRVASLRNRLAAAALPDVAAADVRSALAEVERHLDDLDHVARTVEEALGSIDVASLRTRVQALSGEGVDPEAVAERDRLARTLADLEAHQARQARVDADLGRVDAALAELEAVLVEAATRDVEDDTAVDALLHTARLTRDALAATEAERPPRRRDPA